MPIQNGEDDRGWYFRFGELGKKYYYSPVRLSSKMEAREKAAKQGRAIEWRKHMK